MREVGRDVCVVEGLKQQSINIYIDICVYVIYYKKQAQPNQKS